jgi:hypothetical protein
LQVPLKSYLNTNLWFGGDSFRCDGHLCLISGGHGRNRDGLDVERRLAWLQRVLVKSALQTRQRQLAALNNVVVVEGGVITVEDGAVVGGAVAHLVVSVHLATLEKHPDVWQQVGAEGAELGQSGHGCCTHWCVFQDNAVVDEADVARGLLCARTFFAQQVQDAHCQTCVLAVLDELAQVRQS